MGPIRRRATHVSGGAAGHGAPLERTRYPGIFRRGSRYVVKWREGGRQRSATFRTLSEARAAKRRYDAGDSRAEARVRFADYAADWVQTYRGRTSGGLAPGTLHSYRAAIERHALPMLGHLRLSDIRPADIRRLVASIEQTGLKPSSVRRELAPLKALLNTAVEDGLIAANPAAVVRVARRDRLGEEPEPARVLTRQEIALLRAQVAPAWLLPIDLLLHTGLRISELCGLQWRDLELGANARLNVRRQFYQGVLRAPKSRAGRRTIPLSPHMAERLLTHRRLTAHGGDHAPVFASSAGTPLSPNNLRSRILRPAVRRAGLERVGFHTLRHTCASLLVAEGRNIKQVQTWLGHHDASFTLSTYVHLLDEGVGDAVFLDQITPITDAVDQIDLCSGDCRLSSS